MDSRVVEQRRKICASCVEKAQCPHRHTILERQSACPLGHHLSYEEALHAITHGGPPAHGCCDTAAPGL